MIGKKRLPISFRVREDILHWFKTKAPHGYQTAMHAVLEKHVEEERAKATWTAGRAQEIFHKYYARCFWHYSKSLRIGPDEVPLVIKGLRKYGGREGLKLAEELCR